MIGTGHWSATGPNHLGDYHIEGALTGTLTAQFHQELLAAKSPTDVDFVQLKSIFTVWKNDPLTYPTDYGTWDFNHDPRDGSSDIEIGMLCMAGATTTDWGQYPFTIAHAWILAGLFARVAALKNIDIIGTIPLSASSVLQNGPVYAFATHAERAIQTVDFGVPGGGASSLEASEKFGYGLFSGDSDLRWDMTILDPSQMDEFKTALNAGDCRALAIKSGSWIRAQAHAIKDAGISDWWGLND